MNALAAARPVRADEGECELEFEPGRLLREFLKRAPNACAALGLASAIVAGNAGGCATGFAEWRVATELLLLSGDRLSRRKRRPSEVTKMLWSRAVDSIDPKSKLLLSLKRAEKGTAASSPGHGLGAAATGRPGAAMLDRQHAWVHQLNSADHDVRVLLGAGSKTAAVIGKRHVWLWALCSVI